MSYINSRQNVYHHYYKLQDLASDFVYPKKGICIPSVKGVMSTIDELRYAGYSPLTFEILEYEYGVDETKNEPINRYVIEEFFALYQKELNRQY